MTGLFDGEAAWADFDNDGDLDLALSGASADGPQLLVYGNDPPGTLASPAALTGIESSDLTIGDFDGDSDLDLVAGGNTGAALSTVLYQNDGGTLSELAGTAFPGIRGGDLILGDYDNDQFMDLVIVGNNGSNPFMSIYRNQLGSLETPDTPFEVDGNLTNLQAAQGVDFSAVSMSDIDGDGDLDLFSAGRFDLFTAAPLTTVNDNIVAAGNFLPGVPPSISQEVVEDAVTLSWGSATEAPAPHAVTYNLRVGTEPDGHDVLSGNVPLGPGNAGTNLTHRLQGLVSGTYYWSVQAVDDGFARSAWSTPSEFIIDTVRPQTFPPNFSRVQAGIGQTVAAVLRFEDAHSGVDPDIEPVVTATIAGETFAFRVIQFNGTAWGGELTVSGDMPSGLATLTVTNLFDLRGNEALADTTTDAFAIDTVVPAVATSSPSAGEEGVPSTTSIVSITLSEPIDPQTATAENFSIQLDNQPLTLLTAPEYDDTVTVQLLPDGGLRPGTLYTVQVSAGIQDLFGNRPATDSTWTFSTVIPDTASVTPPAGTAGVAAADVAISAVFDNPLLTEQITTNNVQLLQEGEPLGINPVYNEDSRTITLNPDAPIRVGTPYQIFISGAVGGPLRQAVGDVRWSFSTQIPDTTSVTPAAGASGVVAANAQIRATFDSPLLQDQISAENVQLLREGELVSAIPSYDSESRSITLTPAAEIRPGTPYQIFVSGAVGGPLRQAADDVRWDFSTQIPDTTSVTPAAGANGVVAADAQIRATFDSPLLQDQVSAENVQLLREGELVSAIPSYDSQSLTLTLTPAEAISPRTPYQIFISGAVGGPLRQAEGDVRWDFSTQIPDTTLVIPAAGAVGIVAADAQISALFDSPLLPNQVTAENVQLLREGEIVSAAPTYDADSRSITLNPDQALKPGTPYQIFISGAVGGPLRQAAGDVRWDFNTLVPTVDTFSPTADEEVSSGARRIAVNFTSSIDEDLVTPDRFRLTQGGVSVPLDQSSFNYLDETRQILLPSVDLEPGSQYEVTVSAQVSGPLGAEAPDQQWTFTTQVPQLVDSTPAAGAVAVDVDEGDLTVQFDTPPSSAVESDGVVQLFAQGIPVPLGPITFLDASRISFEPVDEDLNPGTTYQVRIGADAGGPRRSDDYIWSFTTAIPDIQSLMPAADAADVAVPLAEVQVEFSSAIDEDALETDGNLILLESGTQIESSVAIDESEVTITAIDGFRAGTRYEVFISGAVGGPLRQAVGDFRWNFSTRVPDIAEVSPANAEEVDAGERRIAVTFTSRIDSDLANDPDLFQLSQGGNRIQLQSQNFVYDEQTLQVLYPIVALEPGSQYEVSVSSQVRGPIGADQADRQWTFNTTVPALQTTTPAAGATDVAVDSSAIRVQFDAPPARGIDQPGVVQLLAQGEAVTIGAVSFLNDRTITFAPESGNLRAGTPYQVRIAASAGGPRREADYEWTFATLIPTLESITPESDAQVSAAELDQVEVTFSAPIDDDKTDATRFTLATNGESVPLRDGDPVALDEDGRVFALAPAGDWQVGSTYTLLLSAELSGPLGSGQAVTRQFTTAIPEVARTSPEDGSASVVTADPVITIGFDIPPDPSISDVGAVQLAQQGVEVSLSTVTFADDRTITFQPTNEVLLAGTQYQVTIDGSAGGPRRVGDYEFSFSTIVPELQSVSPAADTDVNAGDLNQIEITFSAAIDIDKADTDHFILTRNGENVALRDDDPIALDTDSRAFGLAPVAGWKVGSAYVLQITPDVSGPLGSAQSELSQFTTAVPQLEQITPEADSDTVSPLDRTITVQFDIPPDASINQPGVVQFVEQGEAVAISAVSSIDDRTVTFEPAEGLRAGTRYQVFIPSTVGGPRQTQAYTWQFSTLVPGLLGTTPGLREANVNIDSSLIVAAFSAPIDPELLTPANFALFREGEAVVLVDGDPRDLGDGRYGLAPAAGLAVGSSYRLQIAPVVTGPLGLDQPIVTTFSTAFPSLVEVAPSANAADVPTSDSRISVVFDNPLDAAAAVDSANIDLLWESTAVAISPPSYTEDPSTLSFEPVGGLIAGSNYIVRIDGSIGGPLRQAVGDFVWRFSTRLPFLANTRPTNGAEGVSTSTPTIQMIFSDPIASQDPANFQLFVRQLGRGPGPEGDRPAPRIFVPITGFGAEGDTVISFTPQGGLRPFTEYKVLINRDVLGPLATSGDSLVFQTAGRLENAAGGGLVENPGRSVAIYFPPNAIDRAAEVIIRRLPDEDVSEKAAVQDEQLTRISPAYLIDAGEAVLRKPVTLTMRYLGDGSGSSDPTSLAIFRWLGDGNWSRVGGTAEPGEPVLRTTVEKLGTFAIFEDLSAPVGSLSVQDLDCQPRAFSPITGDKRETDISFSLTGPADVTVRVYNASGRLERVIERDRPMSQGRVLVTWNGEDEEREAVASGLYIVVVNAGSSQQEKVIAVVR